MLKLVYILIGPKGAGKSYIGKVVSEVTDIKFLRVESIWLGLKDGLDGWQAVEDSIDELLMNFDRVIIESLGCGEGFERLKNNLENKYQVKLIKVSADLNKCYLRVKERDQSEHINVSDDKVKEYNEIAVKVNYDWDAIIDNNGPATIQEIINAFK